MRPLCVIPARRGSKRLPLKNILPVGGQPMLVHTVQAAIDSGIFDSVHVSTDGEEIARIAETSGARVHARSEALAGDLVSATDVCLDVEKRLGEGGDRYDAIMCLQPTSPLRSALDIRNSWQRFVSGGADYLVSVTAIDPHYFHWAVRDTGRGWETYFGDQFMLERPLLPPVYRPNGAIKIGRSVPLQEVRNFFGPRLDAYPMPEDRSIHVAERFDLDLADWLMQRVHAPRQS